MVASPTVRPFAGVEGYSTHFRDSMEPIEQLNGAELAARLPAAAKEDLLEWNPNQDLTAWFNQLLTRELPVEKVLHPDSTIRITDDRPYNEYFLLRGKQL